MADVASTGGLNGVLRELEKAVHVAGKTVTAGGGGGAGAEGVSSATRRRALTRAGKALKDASAKLSASIVEVNKLEREREDAVLGKKEADLDAKEARGRLRQSMEALEEATGRLKVEGSTRDELTRRVDALKVENESLSSQLKNRDVQLAETEAALADAEWRGKSATFAATTHKNAVAKLTADNLLLVTRCTAYDEDLKAASNHIARLQEAAERSQGEWFDRMRQEVESRVKAYIEDSEAEREKLRKVREETEGIIKKARCEKEEALQEAAETEEQLRTLQQENALTTDNLTTKSVQVEKVTASLQKETEKSENLQAEVLVLTAALKDTRTFVSMYQRERDEAHSRERDLEAQIRTMERMNRDTAAAASSAKEELQSQKRVNEALMRRKEEVEWKYLGVVAGLDRRPDQALSETEKNQLLEATSVEVEDDATTMAMENLRRSSPGRRTPQQQQEEEDGIELEEILNSGGEIVFGEDVTSSSAPQHVIEASKDEEELGEGDMATHIISAPVSVTNAPGSTIPKSDELQVGSVMFMNALPGGQL